MKNYFYFFIAFILFNCKHKPTDYNQDTAGKASIVLGDCIFYTNTLFGLDENEKAITFYFIRPKTQLSGNTITFSKNGNFVSKYYAECGNDCFTKVYGKYHLLKENKISIKSDSITYYGICKAETEIRNSEPKTFIINKKEKQVELTLVK